MKKKLLLMIVLTGIIVSASFSVFADSNIGPSTWFVSGNNADDTVNYYCVVKGYSGRYVIDINITNNSSSESAVFNTSYFYLHWKNYVNYESDRPTNITIEGGAFVADRNYTSTPGTPPVLEVTLDLFLENAVLKPSESKNYRIDVVGINGTYNTSTIYLTLSIPNTTSASDPSYEATVTANDIATQEQVIHQQELQWYQQNEQAINQVGLDNFNFGSGTLSGLQVIQQHFGDIWSALGDLNLIYTFTLLMSLATFIIRHLPNTKRHDPNEDEIRESHDLRYRAVQRLHNKYGNH